jgi:hypothetical protein
LLESNSQVFFVDEAVFTVNQLKTKAWYPMRNAKCNKVMKNKLSFVCIAVVAAIDIRGKIIALEIVDNIIALKEFRKLMNAIARERKPGAAYVYCDNLGLHHSYQVKKKAEQKNL